MRTEAGGDLHGLSLVGGYSVEATPVPIPNTTVKLYCADGTAGVARWESTSPPAHFWAHPLGGGPLFLNLCSGWSGAVLAHSDCTLPLPREAREATWASLLEP